MVQLGKTSLLKPEKSSHNHHTCTVSQYHYYYYNVVLHIFKRRECILSPIDCTLDFTAVIQGFDHREAAHCQHNLE